MAALLARSDMKYITCILITVLVLISCSGSRKQAELSFHGTSAWYPEGMEDEVAHIIPMIDKYPYGPDGSLKPGEPVL